MFTKTFFHIVSYLMIPVYGLPALYCLYPINRTDCGLPPTPVFSYYKPGSRCEIEIWRGCPSYNRFDNEITCSHYCIQKIINDADESDEIAEELKTENSSTQKLKYIYHKKREPNTAESATEEAETGKPKAEELEDEEPKVEELKSEEPEVDEPEVKETEAEELASEETESENAKAAEPATNEPSFEEPTTEEPVAEKTKTVETESEEPTTEETATEESEAEESEAEEPITEKTAAELFKETESCKMQLNISDCGSKSISVYTYNNLTQACEKAEWKGCETENIFSNDVTCTDVCVDICIPANVTIWKSTILNLTETDAENMSKIIDNFMSPFENVTEVDVLIDNILSPPESFTAEDMELAIPLTRQGCLFL